MTSESKWKKEGVAITSRAVFAEERWEEGTLYAYIGDRRLRRLRISPKASHPESESLSSTHTNLSLPQDQGIRPW